MAASSLSTLNYCARYKNKNTSSLIFRGVWPPVFFFFLFCFVLRFYFFIHERHTERETETEIYGRRRSRLPVGSPMRDSIPGPWDHDLSQRQMLHQLSHPVPLYSSSYTDNRKYTSREFLLHPQLLFRHIWNLRKSSDLASNIFHNL